MSFSNDNISVPLTLSTWSLKTDSHQRTFVLCEIQQLEDQDKNWESNWWIRDRWADCTHSKSYDEASGILWSSGCTNTDWFLWSLCLGKPLHGSRVLWKSREETTMERKPLTLCFILWISVTASQHFYTRWGNSAWALCSAHWKRIWKKLWKPWGEVLQVVKRIRAVWKKQNFFLPGICKVKDEKTHKLS